MDDFEQFLKRQPLRKIPVHWREEILCAVQPEPVKTQSTQTPWWLAWLWPSPVAWGALACAWMLIIGLNAASRPASNKNTARASMSSEAIANLIVQQRQLVQELFRSEAEPAEPPRNRRTPGACNARANQAAIV